VSADGQEECFRLPAIRCVSYVCRVPSLFSTRQGRHGCAAADRHGQKESPWCTQYAGHSYKRAMQSLTIFAEAQAANRTSLSTGV